jgi:hypothetical protein
MVILRATSNLGGQKEDKGMMCSINLKKITRAEFLFSKWWTGFHFSFKKKQTCTIFLKGCTPIWNKGHLAFVFCYGRAAHFFLFIIYYFSYFLI